MINTERFYKAICLLAAGLGSGGAAADTLFRPLGADSDALDPFRWNNRPVVIFAPSETDPAYRDALARLDVARSAMHERDIVVLTDTDTRNPSFLRQRLDPDGFLMLLFGKDGGVKLRSGDIIPIETLTRTIDGMPMRQREMRQD